MSSSTGEADSGAAYDKPAAGWGALFSTLGRVWHEQSLTECTKALLQVNQPDGFDCPGCAWPERPHTTRFEFCENGAKAVAAETTARRLEREFFATHTVAELASHDDCWLEDQGRLTEPLRYDPSTDRYEAVSWEEAFGAIGAALRRIDHPDRAIFYTSGRTSNEAAFLYQLLARRYGTNNLPDCSNMCHESSGEALTESIGIGKGTVDIDDFEKAGAIFVIGQNPGTNHPRMLATLEAAAKRGAKILTINPLIEPGLIKFLHPQHALAMLTGQATPISSHYYQVLVGGDLAALKGLIKWVLAAEAERPGEVLDHDFIREHCDGYEALVADIAATSWEAIERESGLSREQLREAAQVYIESPATICCWAMGLTQNKHAVPTIQYVTNLLLLRGNLGRPGAGACPVRGHSNVQGDRTVGITERPGADLLAGLERVFGFAPPTAHGFDTVAAIQAMASGEARVFIGMGGNFVRATPDREVTEAAMRRCELTAHVSTKLNRSHLVHGREAYILPCLGRSEVDEQATGPQAVTVEDSMGVVHASLGRKRPASEALRSEPAIVAGIAKATLEGGGGIDWDGLVADYGRIREAIAVTIPELFAGYNEKIAHPGGFRLYNGASVRDWHTATGKARFVVHPLPELSLPAGQLRLMTIRSHDQFNTTVYGYSDRYRGVEGTRAVVLMHTDDLAERGLAPGAIVDVVSHWNDGRRRVLERVCTVEFAIPRGCAAAYFPEANVLVPADSFADRSRCPTSKFVPVTVVPHAG